MIRRPFAVLTVAAALLAVVAAPAEGAISLRLGSPDLIRRVAIQVPVYVSCSPFDASLTHYASEISVSVMQAAGTSIARGSGLTYGSTTSSLPLPYLCDGAEHLVPVSVSATTPGPPFHGGWAVFTVRATAFAGMPCFPGSTGCFMNLQQNSGSLGPTEAALR